MITLHHTSTPPRSDRSRFVPADECVFMESGAYLVQIHRQDSSWGELTHLMIRRWDKQPAHNWEDLQEIKAQVCGEDSVAVEVYPSAADLVDTANVYHLWVMPTSLTLPFGLHRLKPTAPEDK